MLTIFAIPKAFEGHDGIIQRNAIESWSRLLPECEIILCADDPGVAEVADEFGLKHLPGIARNDYGTPYLNSAFDQVMEVANNHLLCYVNADIILLSDFLGAVSRIRFPEYLMIGQRWDVDIAVPLASDGPEYDQRLISYVEKNGQLHPPSGIDYFVFPRNISLGTLPPFVVGRPGWDNWFVYQAGKHGLPIIDATRVAKVIHQNHGYDHVLDRRGSRAHGPEGDMNTSIAGNERHNIQNATHIMTSKAVLPASGYNYIRRRWRALLRASFAKRTKKLIAKSGFIKFYTRSS